jgi:hypothetical protein
MSEQMLLCPHCNQEFPITKAITHQLKESLMAELMPILQAQQATTIEELQSQLEAEKARRKEAEQAETELRKERQMLLEEKEGWELTKQRVLDAERDAIRQKAIANYAEQQQLKDREKDELIDDLRKTIDNLKQKVEQGSQQAQGEALELVIEDFLKQKFPLDKILPVPKGVNGADILQQVYNQYGQHCGTIIWETKRTKSWGSDWCSKLKEDQQTAKADIAVLVSRTLPKDVVDFAHFEGVWVTEQRCILGLTTALRMSLIDINAARRASEDKGGKIEDLYNYLTSADFIHRMHAIVDYFDDMKRDLEQEKKAIQKQWKKRETQIERVAQKTIEIRGSLEAIIGRSIVQIDDLEILGLPEEVDLDTEAAV